MSGRKLWVIPHGHLQAKIIFLFDRGVKAFSEYNGYKTLTYKKGPSNKVEKRNDKIRRIS